jgi:hypothetical protein
MTVNITKLAKEWLDIYKIKFGVTSAEEALVLDFAGWLELFIQGKEVSWQPTKRN